MDKRQALTEFLKGNFKALTQIKKHQQKAKKGFCIIRDLGNSTYQKIGKKEILTRQQANELSKEYLLVWSIVN